jgi:polygalacturonase
MKNLFWCIAILLATRCISPAVELDAQKFGAKGDGKTLNTRFIQKAIDECSKQGGGTVKFPAGDYVSGTILLKDNVRLQLDDQAALLGSLDIADYTAPDTFRSGNGAAMGFCFIGAVGATNVSIVGAGVIDGRGKELLAARPKGNNARPFLMRFVRCDQVSLNGIHLQGPAAWTTHFFQCKNVSAEQVTIASRGLANNDGFDIDSSENVRIQNCNVDSGDDAVCLKTTSLSPCRNVEVSGCDLKSHDSRFPDSRHAGRN